LCLRTRKAALRRITRSTPTMALSPPLVWSDSLALASAGSFRQT